MHVGSVLGEFTCVTVIILIAIGSGAIYIVLHVRSLALYIIAPLRGITNSLGRVADICFNTVEDYRLR